MKTTITESYFIDRFMAIRREQFSREALRALFEHYEQLEADCGEEVEFDPIAICCDWTEYDSFQEAAEAYSWNGAVDAEDERADLNERKAQEWLFDQTTVLELSSGCVVLNF